MRPYVKALQARKLTASAIDLPRSKAERAVPVFIEKVPAGAIAGGHSYGGRVSSMAAIQVRYAALHRTLAGDRVSGVTAFRRIGSIRPG